MCRLLKNKTQKKNLLQKKRHLKKYQQHKSLTQQNIRKVKENVCKLSPSDVLNFKVTKNWLGVEFSQVETSTWQERHLQVIRSILKFYSILSLALFSSILFYFNFVRNHKTTSFPKIYIIILLFIILFKMFIFEKTSLLKQEIFY